MAIDKLIPQYLNTDSDERYVKSMEMFVARNVRVSPGEAGSGGVLKNVKGNTPINPRSHADAIPTDGFNRVIGEVAVESEGVIYYCLYNSDGKHGIYAYFSQDDRYEKLYQDSILNFQQNGFVKMDVVINQYGNHLLYFTDNFNEPRKINATKLRDNLYDEYITAGSSEQKNLYFTAAKKPPLYPPTYQFQTDDSVRFNNLKESVLQFAYQYVYDDGEVSSLSPYSELAVSNTNLAYDITSRNTFSDNNNTLKITVRNEYGDVDKIRVFARNNNEGTFYKIKELVNQDPQQGANPTQDFLFKNDGVYTILSDQERDKMFNSLPQTVKAQAFSNNRIFYGNYTEGFDPVNTSTLQYPVYRPRPGFLGVNLNNEPAEIEDDFERDKVVTGSFTNVFNKWNGNTVQNFAYSFGGDNRPRIIVDVTEIPPGLSYEPVTCVFEAQAQAMEFGVGTVIGLPSPSGQATMDFSVPISVSKDADNDNNIDTDFSQQGVLNFCRPVSITIVGDPPYPNEYLRTDRSLGNLFSDSGVSFSSQFTIPPMLNRQEVIDFIGNSAVGLTGTCFVRSSWEQGQGPTVTLTNDTAYVEANFTDGGPMPHVKLWMSGYLTFTIDSYTYYQEDERDFLSFDIIMTDVNLSTEVAEANSFVLPIGGGTPDQAQTNIYSPYVNPGTIEYFANQGEVTCNINSSLVNGIGLPLVDSRGSDPDTWIFTGWRRFTVSSKIDLLPVNNSQVSSFKAGATHEVAIAYADKRGRLRSLDKVDGSVDVSHFGSDKRRGRMGVTNIDMRVMHTPPVWAEAWYPLISKNLSYGYVLQNTCAEAFIGGSDTYDDPLARDGAEERPIIQSLEGSDKGVIYLSMRTLEGKDGSYKELKGSDINYQFSKGDRLRVLQYEDENGVIQRPIHEFVITGYNYYADDDKNPILIQDVSETTAEDNYRRTGWFLELRDDDIDGFNRESIEGFSDYFSQKCLVEIVRPKKREDRLTCYEIGRGYPIEVVNGQRYHGGDRSKTEEVVFDINVLTSDSFSTNVRLYVGDYIDSLPTPFFGSFISEVVLNQNETYTYFISGQFNANAIGGYFEDVSVRQQGGNDLLDGVVTITQGDVYLRVRECLANKTSPYTVGNGDIYKFDPTLPKDQLYQKFIIEDESVSDFFSSKATSIGRAHIENPSERNIRRGFSITYSDPFVFDSSKLNLNSFNPSLFPFKDYGSNNGEIDYLIDGNESLLVLQGSKVSNTPINRQLIETASNGMLVSSTNVMGNEVEYSGDFGPSGNPESVRSYLGRTYFTDRKNRKVIQLGGDGMSIVSDNDISRYLESILDGLPPGQKIPCGYDPLHKEFIMSPIKKIFLIESEGGGDSPTGEELTGVFPQVNYTDSTDTVDRDDFSFIDEDETIISERGNGVVMLDRLNEYYPAVILDKNLAGVSEDIFIIGKDGDNRYPVVYNAGSGLITLPEGVVLSTPPLALASGPPPTTGEPEEDKGDKFIYRGNTISYHTIGGKWITYYDFIPDLYSNVGNKFLAFSNGQIYLQNSNPSHGTFFGESFPALFGVVSKNNPSDVKVYRALSIEGNARWDVALSNDDQSSIIPSTSLEEKENFWYHDVLRDQSNSTRNIVVLSKLAEPFPDGATEMKFLSRVNNLPFHIGEALFLFNGDQYVDTGLTVSSIVSEKVIGVSGTQTQQIPAGSFIVTIDDSLLSGDNMRGHYMKMILTNDDRTSVEMHAVNLVYDHSPLHNAQVN